MKTAKVFHHERFALYGTRSSFLFCYSNLPFSAFYKIPFIMQLHNIFLQKLTGFNITPEVHIPTQYYNLLPIT